MSLKKNYQSPKLLARLTRYEIDKLQVAHDSILDRLSLLDAWARSSDARELLIDAMLKLSDAMDILEDECLAVLGPDDARV